MIFTRGLEAAQKITASHPLRIPSNVLGFNISTPVTFLILFLSLILSITNVFIFALSLSTISTFLRVIARTFIFLFNNVLTVSPPVYPDAPNTATLLILS